MKYIMNKDFYDYLYCSHCQSSLLLIIKKENKFGIKEGRLKYNNCHKIYLKINFIPRFVEKEKYSSSFGFEHTIFGKLRSDK